MNCLFCKLIDRKINSNILYEDDLVIVFDDIRPQAPQHKLIIPKRHIATVNDLQVEDKDLIGYMILIGKRLAQDIGISDQGYRLVLNCNPQGGQEVYHIHIHLLGGRQMHWPPG